MKTFAEKVKEYDDFVALQGADDEQIEDAESRLGLKFSEEYKAFLKEYGIACANGHEFFGICKSQRLDIVEKTIEARNEFGNVPDDLYLIEDLGIDWVLVWQREDGALFQTQGNSEPAMLEMTLCEYLDN